MPSATLDNIDRPESMPILESIWQSGAAFLQRCMELDDGTTAWMQAVRDDDVALAGAGQGTLFAVTFHFLDRDMSFNVHAVVVAAAKSGWAMLRFLDEERVRRDMVLACAEGQPFPYRRRRYPRLLCRLPTQVQIGNEEQHEALATDISEGGVRVFMRPPIRRGSRVSLQISLPTSHRTLAATGYVTHTKVTGAHTSAGIAFELESAEESDAVARMVRSLG